MAFLLTLNLFTLNKVTEERDCCYVHLILTSLYSLRYDHHQSLHKSVSFVVLLMLACTHVHAMTVYFSNCVNEVILTRFAVSHVQL